MTRKRFIKFLMRMGLDRKQSNMFACYAKYYGSYQEMFNDVFLFFYNSMENTKCKASPMMQAAFMPMYFFKMLENPNIKKRLEPIIYGVEWKPTKQEDDKQ